MAVVHIDADELVEVFCVFFLRFHLQPACFVCMRIVFKCFFAFCMLYFFLVVEIVNCLIVSSSAVES